jgi:hypothetical protein
MIGIYELGSYDFGFLLKIKINYLFSVGGYFFNKNMLLLNVLQINFFSKTVFAKDFRGLYEFLLVETYPIMKNFTIIFLALCSYTAQAQITPYNNSLQNAFYGIGGYSFSQTSFPDGVQANPYVVSGPSPQNDFSFAASAVGGITNRPAYISTTNTNTAISIKFFGNNVRKFGCNVLGINATMTFATSDIISLTATTNLGNTATQTGGQSGTFVGFNVTGNENEYIISVTASFQTTPSPAARIALYSIMVGDNTPQNVALNFDGVDDYVSIPSNVGNFSTNQDFTVSCWIKPDATTTGEQNIINKWNGSGGYALTIRYYGSNGTVLAGQYDGTNFSYVQSTTNLKDGKWHHVAFVKNGSNLLLYIDGVQEGGTSIDNANLTTTNTTPLQIGREATGTKYFKGEIDEVRIWNIGKTATQVANERFCKTPNTTNLQAFYNFNNGVPHGNNIFITQIAEASNSVNNGTLNNFTGTGDASNFVTGQVKYVRRSATAGLNNGSSWTNAFTSLQSALVANSCNDLFDVYVYRLTYYHPDASYLVSFNIPSGMRMYGGFAGTEKSINERNMALIHSTNRTTLSGDLNADDTPFNFTVNRTDNSSNIVSLYGNNTVFDGFTVRGCKLFTGGAVGIVDGGLVDHGTNSTIKNCRIIDNEPVALRLLGNSTTIANCYVLGNNNVGINSKTFSVNLNNNLIANNFGDGIFMTSSSGVQQLSITNCTIVANQSIGVFIINNGATLTNKIINTIIYANDTDGINIQGATNITNITNSLIQGQTSTTNGNLNGNTTNPQFVSPLASNVRSDAGNYRLKDSSPCINTGTDVGVSPFDLERNLRPKGGKTDMGAYESNINMNEIISVATGNWESNTTWNLDRVPLVTDKVIVNGHQVTVTTNTARAKDLEYKTGAILRYLSGGLLRFGF